jgi:cytochrome c peroxidase
MKYTFVFLFFLGISISFYSFENTTEKLPANKEELGKRLFFEKKLSRDNSISCASCHIPEYAFSDTLDFSIGVGGRKGKRNTPSAMNMASREIFFFDGRAATLEIQATFPIQDHNEMDINIDKAVSKIAQDKFYQNAFKKIYKKSPNKTNILSAIADYERSLESSSPFDDYMNGDKNAISESAKRGHKVFMNPKNKCFDCHFTPDFTGDEFRNIGLFNGKELNDSGRYLITKNKNDIGKFKVPGLRNIAVTGPYMHNGMFKTLQEVIAYYNNPIAKIPNAINTDTLLHKPLLMSDNEMIDLEEFLKTLTDPSFVKKKP